MPSQHKPIDTHARFGYRPSVPESTLLAELKLGATTIASSATFEILPGGSPATVTLVATGPASPPVAGTLCLTITNQTVDSNPNNGAAHDAKINSAGSKILGPWDP
jgi:hypothetical protein